MSASGTLSFYELGVVPVLVRNGDYYRLISAMFVHAGILHLASNMATLLYVGNRLENKIGHFKYLVAFLLCGFAGNVAVLLFSNPNTVTVGASGAIFGLMGMLFISIMKDRDWKGFAVIGQNIAVNLYMTFTNVSISVNGHLGGLICGLLLGFFFSFDRRNQGRTEKGEGEKKKAENSNVVLIIVLAVVVLIAAGMSAMLSDGQKKNGLPGMAQNPDIESVMKVSPDRTLITK